ncbi:ABC transporter [Saccharobesus litoralis]|uniref:ABC transporter n=1 Tax=Saccharobesus litoralis TaxID=2172099 RepID=A0A2S0VNN6_9ALTE|nr:ABC transporter permease [Saccharobesus litoralis]AWB65690.1 ABC transporter [Saccharobesus litoralis]
MTKTWIFFKLRMLQLRYDKTALFFSYIFPVILLTGIGYPMELMNKAEIKLHYIDQVQSEASAKVIQYLHDNALVNLIVDPEPEAYQQRLKANELKQLLLIKPADNTNTSTGTKTELALELVTNDEAQNVIENQALNNVVNAYFTSQSQHVAQKTISAGSVTSYITILLPGLIGMTLLIIGLNGFGGVLIEEGHEGLFRNIKTIDASPLPFLSGLLFSRLVVCFSIALSLFMIGIFMFNLSWQFDLFLWLLIVLLGSCAFLGIGLIIAVLSPSVNGFNGIVNFVQLPFVVFSGVFFSISAFPDWLQWVTQLIPLTHMNIALHAVMFDGVNMTNVAEIGKELAVLSFWCLASLYIGWKRFKW